jgi:ankyrin repeat protein
MMMNSECNTPLHEAVKQRRSAVALRLLEVEPNCGHTPNVDMQTPLHIAAREGLTDVVEKILDIPWVPEKFVATANVRGTALHQAVLGGHTRKNSFGLCSFSHFFNFYFLIFQFPNN